MIHGSYVRVLADFSGCKHSLSYWIVTYELFGVLYGNEGILETMHHENWAFDLHDILDIVECLLSQKCAKSAYELLDQMLD